MLGSGFMHKYKALIYAAVFLLLALLLITPNVQMPVSDVVNLYNKHITRDTNVMNAAAKEFGVNYRIGDHIDDGTVVIYIEFPKKFSDEEKNEILIKTALKIADRFAGVDNYTIYEENKTDGKTAFKAGVIMEKSFERKIFMQRVLLSPVLYATINNGSNFSIQGESLMCKALCYPFFIRSVNPRAVFGHTLLFGFTDSNATKHSYKSRYVIVDCIPAEIYTFKLFGLNLSGQIRYHPGKITISRLVNFESLKQTAGR